MITTTLRRPRMLKSDKNAKMSLQILCLTAFMYLASLIFSRIIPSMTPDSVPRLQRDVSSASDCHLSIWRPTDELRQLLKEGCPFRVTNVTAYPSR